MTRVERRVHVWVWVALTPLLVTLVILAVRARTHVPVQPATTAQEPRR